MALLERRWASSFFSLLRTLTSAAEFAEIFLNEISCDTLNFDNRAALAFSVGLLLRNESSAGLPALLHLVTVYERFLKDTLKAIDGIPEASVPFLTKDVLLAPSLSKALGSHIIAILRLLLGPVNSFNLRNVVWHGFAHAEDFSDSAKACTALLLLLFCQICRLLSPRPILHSPRSKLHTFDCQSGTGGPSSNCTLDWKPKALLLAGIAETSSLVRPSTSPSWRSLTTCQSGLELCIVL
jgi:hypothetical protein